jgi:hypothetical protein
MPLATVQFAVLVSRGVATAALDFRGGMQLKSGNKRLGE